MSSDDIDAHTGTGITNTPRRVFTTESSLESSGYRESGAEDIDDGQEVTEDYMADDSDTSGHHKKKSCKQYTNWRPKYDVSSLSQQSSYETKDTKHVQDHHTNEWTGGDVTHSRPPPDPTVNDKTSTGATFSKTPKMKFPQTGSTTAFTTAASEADESELIGTTAATPTDLVPLESNENQSSGNDWDPCRPKQPPGSAPAADGTSSGLSGLSGSDWGPGRPLIPAAGPHRTASTLTEEAQDMLTKEITDLFGEESMMSPVSRDTTDANNLQETEQNKTSNDDDKDEEDTKSCPKLDDDRLPAIKIPTHTAFSRGAIDDVLSFEPVHDDPIDSDDEDIMPPTTDCLVQVGGEEITRPESRLAVVGVVTDDKSSDEEGDAGGGCMGCCGGRAKKKNSKTSNTEQKKTNKEDKSNNNITKIKGNTNKVSPLSQSNTTTPYKRPSSPAPPRMSCQTPLIRSGTSKDCDDVVAFNNTATSKD